MVETAHRVVIVGGGFGGLYAARALRRVPVDLTLIDRRNFHLFQPLLYQVATGGLSPADIAAPLRAVLARQPRARVVQAEVTDVDARGRRVHTTAGAFDYDTLILAAGVGHHYFGHPEWAAFAPGLKTVEDATHMRSRILSAFEQAELVTSDAERRRLMTFVIVGAGPTGVELAGAIGELARHTLRREFRRIDPSAARVLLVEAAPQILPSYPAVLSEAAQRSLERLGVEVLQQHHVVAIDAEAVELSAGGARQRIVAATVLWAAGVQASPLAQIVAGTTGCAVDRSGRLAVAADCSVPGHPELLAIGDIAHMVDGRGRQLPGVAPVAMQQGAYVARLIATRLRGGTLPPFRYRDRGSLAVIGRAAAVADMGRLRFSGYPAWLLWLFVHIMYLVEFENRLLVFTQWAFSYFTRNRGARLITR